MRKYIHHGFTEYLTKSNSGGVPMFYFKSIILTNNTKKKKTNLWIFTDTVLSAKSISIGKTNKH